MKHAPTTAILLLLTLVLVMLLLLLLLLLLGIMIVYRPVNLIYTRTKGRLEVYGMTVKRHGRVGWI
jgi:hypothetical protein